MSGEAAITSPATTSLVRFLYEYQLQLYHVVIIGVVDDSEMKVTEVVRGQDLTLSTARQLLLYYALKVRLNSFYIEKIFYTLIAQ